MSGRRLVGRSRRWLPQTVRVRLSLLYAALFLVAGAVLLGLTYGLVAGSLSTGGRGAKFTAAQFERLKNQCTASRAAIPKGKSAAVPLKLPKSCFELEQAGAAVATADQRTRVLGDLLLFSLVGLGVLTVCSGGLGWVMAGKVLRPVTAITGAARRASERHLGERLNLGGPADELKELADTFDGMLERLDVAFASQKRFVADASHELRTPLTVMRTSIDVALAKSTRSPEMLEAMARKVRRSVDRAESLITALLTLAVSEQDLTVAEGVDMTIIAEDALDLFGRDIAARGISVTTDLAEAETIGDRVLLERLAANLVDNALRHNRPRGWVHVATGTTLDGDPHLSVSNSGDALEPKLVESLFDPFRTVKGRAGNEGFGLGLAIVKSIASAHDGAIAAQARPGGGLDITIVFPRASSGTTVPSGPSEPELPAPPPSNPDVGAPEPNPERSVYALNTPRVSPRRAPDPGSD